MVQHGIYIEIAEKYFFNIKVRCGESVQTTALGFTWIPIG